jgi:hypothetical protein
MGGPQEEIAAATKKGRVSKQIIGGSYERWESATKHQFKHMHAVHAIQFDLISTMMGTILEKIKESFYEVNRKHELNSKQDKTCTTLR